MSARDYIARLWGLRTAFRQTFLQADGKPNGAQRMVLEELRRFCYGSRPTIKRAPDGLVDPYASVAAAARQEVYMRITSMLNLDDRDLHEMSRNQEMTADAG